VPQQKRENRREYTESHVGGGQII